MDFCWQSSISAFYCAVWVGHSFSSKEQVSSNFMAAVSIGSDFGAQEKKVCHCFLCFPIYLPWSDGTRCPDLLFFECWVLSQVFHFPLSLSSRVCLVPLPFLLKCKRRTVPVGGRLRTLWAVSWGTSLSCELRHILSLYLNISPVWRVHILIIKINFCF